VAFFCGVVASLATQVKKIFYYNCYLTDVFFPLAIEIFLCFHQHANNFLHRCVNMVWTVKGNKNLLLSMLCSFYKQRVSIELQKTQVTTISKQAFTIGEGFSRLGVLLGLLPFSLIDMLHANGERFNF
jgi:hypothetical protein